MNINQNRYLRGKVHNSFNEMTPLLPIKIDKSIKSSFLREFIIAKLKHNLFSWSPHPQPHPTSIYDITIHVACNAKSPNFECHPYTPDKVHA